jgi:hypothetical protein
MFTPDDTPTLPGRIAMLGQLLSVPAAFVINLLAMRTRAGAPAAPFMPTPARTAIGLCVLAVVSILFAQPVLNELNPFVRPLGAASILGQGLCLLSLLPLPIAFMLNRLPRLTRPGSKDALIFQPTSASLIVGAAVLLMILMLASGFMLEEIACRSGIPNCD